MAEFYRPYMMSYQCDIVSIAIYQFRVIWRRRMLWPWRATQGH